MTVIRVTFPAPVASPPPTRWKSLLLDDFRHLTATVGWQSANSRKVPVSSGLVPHVLPLRRRRNWPKHAAFSVLVVLGLAFWIPPWLRATVGETGDGVTPPDDSPREALSSDGEFTTTKLLETPNANLTAASVPTLGKDVIVLTTTIIGKTHRAAVVNGRLHREGDRIVIAGGTFRLASVAEDRIELQSVGNHSASARSLIIRRAPLARCHEMITSFRAAILRSAQAACSSRRPLFRASFAETPALGCDRSERCTIGIAKPCPDRTRSDG